MGSLLIPAAALSAAVVSLAACSQPDRAVWLSKDDRSLDAASTTAKDTLPVFWAKFDARPADVRESLVKVGYPTRHGGIEYLWMDVASHSGSTVQGRLANEPEDVAGVHAGQDVSVETSKIVDWSYRKGGLYYGQFTTRVLLEKADAKTRREQFETLAPTPLEPENH